MRCLYLCGAVAEAVQVCAGEERSPGGITALNERDSILHPALGCSCTEGLQGQGIGLPRRQEGDRCALLISSLLLLALAALSQQRSSQY